MSEALDWILHATEIYPELKHERTVLWYDGPLTNVFRDADGNGYILHWAERLPGIEVERYILLPISAEVLLAWLEKQTDWRATFLTAPYAIVVDILANMVNSEKKTLFEVDEYLPGDGVTIDEKGHLVLDSD